MRILSQRLQQLKSATRSRLSSLKSRLSKDMSDGEKVVAALEVWAKNWMFNDEDPASSRLLPFYRYSPQWTALWEECWSEYDRLIDVQQSTGTSRLSWQDDLENHRRDTESARKRYFRPMDDKPKLWKYAPLSVHLDQYLKTSSQDRLLSWRTALDNWQRFRILAEKDSSFLKSLSKPQKSSVQVLYQWWETTEESLRPLVHTTRSYLETLRDRPYLKDPTDEDNLLELSDHVGTDTSFHHAACFKLFCAEFHPIAWEPYETTVLRDLQDARQSAVGHHTCYLFAHAINRNPEVVVPSYPLPIRNDEAWYDDVAFEEDPYYLWDTVAQETVIVEDLIRHSTEQPPRCPDYLCISHTWGRWSKPTAVHVPGVRWPVPENKRYDVRDLPAMLSQSNLGCRYVWFDLFCIPQSGDDERKDLEIAHQAAIFRKSSRCIAWVNHCDSWDGVENALKWLGLRYLKATHRSPPSWLDPELLRLQALAEDGVELMQTQDGIYGAVGWFTSLWTLQEAVLCPDLEIYSRDWERLAAPATLTTLMCFLEDAPYLCWDPEPHDDVSFANPIVYEISVESCKENRTFSDRFPYGSASLVGLAHNSGMARVLQSLSPMFVFAELNFREYTDVCAPAIMSAIGVTDWFTADSPSNKTKTEQRLVLDAFPLSFLQEAARKIGSPFFETFPRADKMFVAPGTSVTGPGGLMSQGSLLPVNHESMKFTRTNNFEDFHEERCDHPSVAGWVLNEDGSVSMRTAGIAACSSSKEADGEGGNRDSVHSPQPDHPSFLSLSCLSHGVPPGAVEALGDTLEVTQARIPVVGGLEYLEDVYFLTVTDYDFDGTLGLATTLAHISAGAMLFAVVLCSDEETQQGIILAQLEQQDKTGVGKFVKVGCYSISDLPSDKDKLPKSDIVNWLVL